MKKWFKNKLAAITFAFSNVEKNILNQDGKTTDNGTNQEQRYLQGRLADSLIHGEITQEVKNLRWRVYKILKASDDTFLDVDYVDENGNVFYKTKKTNKKAILKKIKLDNYDDYELDMVFFNNEITNSITDSITKYIDEDEHTISAIEYFITNKCDKPLNVKREYLPNFLIESYTKKINIRNIDDKNKLLEFYVSKYPDEYNKNSKLFLKEVKKLIDLGKKNISFINIDEVSFITNNTLGVNDYLLYSYQIIDFDKIIEFDGYYVIKFKAKILSEGEDILLKYVETELEEKYNNKERKK